MKIRFDYYKDGKRKALTMSYDDGRTFDLRLAQIFNLHGIRGTFHLNSGKFGNERYLSPEDVRDKFSGHEISAHTLTHPRLEKVSREEFIYEIMEDRKNLEALCGYPVRGMSYPYGVFSDEIIDLLRALGMTYSRTTKASENFRIPDDFLAWHPTCHHDSPKLFDLLARFKTTDYPMALFYVWGHSFEFDKNNNWERIEQFCTEAAGDPDVWYATNIEIYEYFTALKSLAFSADRTLVYNPTATDVWISVDGAPVRVAAGATVNLCNL